MHRARLPLPSFHHLFYHILLPVFSLNLCHRCQINLRCLIRPRNQLLHLRSVPRLIINFHQLTVLWWKESFSPDSSSGSSGYSSSCEKGPSSSWDNGPSSVSGSGLPFATADAGILNSSRSTRFSISLSTDWGSDDDCGTRCSRLDESSCSSESNWCLNNVWKSSNVFGTYAPPRGSYSSTASSLYSPSSSSSSESVYISSSSLNREPLTIITKRVKLQSQFQVWFISSNLR